MKKRRRRKSDKAAWYVKIFQKWQDSRNRMEKGTTEKKILENPFIMRAHSKIAESYGFRILGMCLSGIGFAALLFYALIAWLPVPVMLKEVLTGKGASHMLMILLFGIGALIFSYTEDALFHSREKVFRKYWTCPFCHRPLPYKKQPGIKAGNARFYLLPGATKDCCPYCGKQLKILPEEKRKNGSWSEKKI